MTLTVCFGLDGLTKVPLITPVLLLIVRASLLVFSAEAVRVMVSFGARLIWLVNIGTLPKHWKNFRP